MPKRIMFISIVSFAIFGGADSVRAQQPSNPPLDKYMLPAETEVALARSAAPSHISDRASVKVLTPDGYRVSHKGDNGFVCMVMRGWTGLTYTPAELRTLLHDPSVRAPICFDPEAVRLVLPYYELSTRLGMEGRTPDEITRGVEAGLRNRSVPVRTHVSFAYLWSADQHLGPGVGQWHPHMMVFAPYYRNAMLGDNEVGKVMPFVSNDGGTPFTVVVIPVDDKLAIKAALP